MASLIYVKMLLLNFLTPLTEMIETKSLLVRANILSTLGLILCVLDEFSSHIKKHPEYLSLWTAYKKESAAKALAEESKKEK